MMIDPDRRVLQPGPAPSERVQWVAGNARLLVTEGGGYRLDPTGVVAVA